MIIVLSPAKKLDFETPLTFAEHTQPDFLDQSEKLIERLRELSPVELSQLMGISDQLSVLNVARYAEWRRPFTLENARPAVLAFNGDVYEGLAAASLEPEALRFAQQHLRILSGLHGVLRPLDLMQPYRLEMGIKLENSKGKDLYQFWGEVITDKLNQALKAQGDDIVINLASDEYFRSVKTKQLQGRIIKPVFLDEKNGQFKVISFYAKKARGLMSRYIIENRLTQPEQLTRFNSEGYFFDAEASGQKDEMVFKRHER